MDYGKFKYEQQKKANEARKKQKVIEIKEIKMRPTIDDHDYDVKMKAMKRFFDDGDKVKVTLRFRGREMAHQHLGMELLTRVQKDTEVFAKLEQYPKMEGRQMMMVLAPRSRRKKPCTPKRRAGWPHAQTKRRPSRAPFFVSSRSGLTPLRSPCTLPGRFSAGTRYGHAHPPARHGPP